ncbi:GCN5-related N acetyltransferase [Moelleriella libera RCEF 2490]|uniref:GCN5-related N acetyltransferase n=1 Tax=Moelleriella libera RCEF 2490 TaxID=1081109 RepID=A0A167WKE1_9HYPO|nr:GCN5-related N acetyltransferase [Moelleriella libera RCEF 2490]
MSLLPTQQRSIRSFFTPKSTSPPSSSTTATTTVTKALPLPAAAATVGPPSAKIPKEACVRIVTPSDVIPLRRINSLLLPVRYSDNFYDGAVENPFCRVVEYTHAADDGDDDAPKVVGGMVCCADSEHATIYIRSLCLLAPYRSMGLATAALEAVALEAQQINKRNTSSSSSSSSSSPFTSLTAHVWTENDEALRWYEARGFTRDPVPVQGYYFKLRPDTAWLMTRRLDSSSSSSSSSSKSKDININISAASRTYQEGQETKHQAASNGGGGGSGGDEKSSPAIKPSPTAAVINLHLQPPPSSSRPAPTTGQSYQNQRPDREWNDLPPEMAPPMMRKTTGSDSAGSSRSSSMAPTTTTTTTTTARRKKDRSYPAAAFGQ